MNNLALMDELLGATAAHTAEAVGLTEQAAEWLDRTDGNTSAEENAAFADWLGRSKRHIAEFLRMCVVREELQALASQGLLSKTDRAVRGDGKVTPLFNLQSRRVGLEERRHQKLWRVFSEKSRAATPVKGREWSSRKRQAENVGALYLQYRKTLLCMLRRRGIDRHDAEDVLQETFLTLVENGSRAGAETLRNLDGYLYATASNAAVRFFRRRARVPFRDVGEEELESLADPCISVEERVQESQFAERFRDLLQQVPREWAYVLEQYSRGQTCGEMSAALGMSKATTQRILVCAMREIRVLMKREGLVSEEPNNPSPE